MESNPKSILFVIPTPKDQENYANSLPPIGVLNMATLLKNNNVKVGVVDCFIEKLEKFNIEDFDAVGFSIMISNVENSLKIAENIKQKFPEKKIIVGGPHVNSNPDFFIKKDFVDYIGVGECEYTMLDLFTGVDVNTIKGLYSKVDGKTIFNGPRDRIKDLDALPFPDLSFVDYKRYWVPISREKPISNIMTSRGCPFKCSFCFASLGRQWTHRSAINVVDEIEYQVKQFGIKEICIFDDNFTMKIERAKEICRLIIERNIKVALQFTNGIRVDRVDKELLQLLKDAGLWLVGVAPESGSAETLRKINKKFNLDKVEEVVKMCHEVGLNTHSYFMVGFHWETKEDIQKSIDLSLKLNTDLTQFSRVVPLPGTELFDQMHFDVDEDFASDRGLFAGNVRYKMEHIEKDEIHKMIKKGFRRFYFNPIRIWRIYRMLSLKSVLSLVKYSLTTDSV